MYKLLIPVFSMLCLAGQISTTCAQSSEQMEIVQKIRDNKEPTFGTWLYLKDPAIPEMFADEGFEWFLIDMEHGNLDEDMIQTLILPLKNSGCVPLVRVPKNDRHQINKLLDVGIMGVMFPWVDTKEDAERAVKSVKYPPLGYRGMGYARAQGWGARWNEYVADANESTLVILIIESKEGVENVDEIVEVPGIDAILTGTWDLAGNLGLIGQFDHPKVLEGKDKIQQACARKNIAFISWASDEKSIRDAIAEGSNMVALEGDVDVIWGSARRLMRDARRATGKANK